MAESLGCATCGDCCEAIWLSANMVHLLEEGAAKPGYVPGPNLVFIVEHWHEQERDSNGAVRYACDAFDPATRLCTTHDVRPPVCRDFPWYGRQPGDLGGGTISKRCSYWLDVAPADRAGRAERPLIPIAVLR